QTPAHTAGIPSLPVGEVWHMLRVVFVTLVAAAILLAVLIGASALAARDGSEPLVAPTPQPGLGL
ncbi:MAG: hypothetical protein ACRDE9_02570, partial [Candidatus Limnocylindria bacterium]